MSKGKAMILNEYVKELDFNLEVLQRFMPVFNINNKDVITSLKIGMDMLDEMRHDIKSSDTLKHTVNVEKVFEDYPSDMDKMTTSASSEIRLLRQKIIEYVEGLDEEE